MSLPQNLPPTQPPVGEPHPQPEQQVIRVRQRLTRPTVMYVILGVTILVYLLQELTRNGLIQQPFMALGQLLMGSEMLNYLISQMGTTDLPMVLGAKISPLITNGQVWRLFTPVVLHASPAHILFNMYALYSIGSFIEAYYGHWRFLALYLLGALGGNILSYWMTPVVSVGASTAIFGLVAAQGVFVYHNRKLFGQRARGMLNNTIFIIAINLMLGLSGGIDNWGHLGGLVGGLAFAWFAGPQLGIDRNQVEPELVDQRSPVMVWLTAVVVAFFMAALALLKFLQG